MAFPRLQAPQDWLSQCWNITVGRRIKSGNDDWLLGPTGNIGGIADHFIAGLAQSEGLTIHRNEKNAGLMDSFESFAGIENLNRKIARFYQNTSDYDFDVWTQWKPIFGSFACLVAKLFTQRIQQLNLPQAPLETSYGIKSEIIILRDETGRRCYTIWFRRSKKSGEVIYAGVYSDCEIPSGEKCLKIIFPLPQGSATVIMRLSTDSRGNLELLSKGKTYGDPGFYFIVEDSKAVKWKNYLRSFHERIFVYEDSEGVLRADHSMSVWGLKAYELHYKLTRRPAESA